MKNNKSESIPYFKKSQFWAHFLGTNILEIEAIFLSGSLSMGHGSEYSDIDFYIITQPKKLWITRWKVMQTLKKYKQATTKKRHSGQICCNHFQSVHTLEIQEKDPYAHDLFGSIIPLYDPHNTYENFKQSNQWIHFQPPLNLKDDLEMIYDPQYYPLLTSAFKTNPYSFWDRVRVKGVEVIQKLKIKLNPQTYRKGAKVFWNKTEIRLHAEPKNKNY